MKRSKFDLRLAVKRASQEVEGLFKVDLGFHRAQKKEVSGPGAHSSMVSRKFSGKPGAKGDRD